MMIGIEDKLSQTLRDALVRLGASPTPPPDAFSEAALRWEIPKEPAFGDLANSVSFKVAAAKRQPPPQVAEELAALFRACASDAKIDAWIDRVEAKRGFLSVFLSQEALLRLLRQIRRQGHRFGTRAPAHPESINIEFVSANPTGPLSVAHGRQAAVGDVLARLLRSQGARVTTEYYLNDEGRQIELLGRSLRARYLQALGRAEPFPEDGYHGAYLTESGARCVKAFGEQLVDAPLERFMELGMEEQLAEIKRVLGLFGLTFDRWTRQRWLRTSGKIDAALEALKAKGALFDAEDATWFASTKFGDDKDRVVRKRDGELTYLAPDIAYHRRKLERGFGLLVNLWGPDHHGYIARLKAAVAAMGFPPETLKILIVQLCTLKRGAETIPMSTREGQFITLTEVMQEVGRDAARFFFLLRKTDAQLEFDLELAKKHSLENPVYYIQYAYARICSIRKQVSAAQVADLALLKAPEELAVLRALREFPGTVEASARSLEPFGIVSYLQGLAETFHRFYDKHRVIGEDVALSAARLELVRAVQTVLASGLKLLGISAPDKM